MKQLSKAPNETLDLYFVSKSKIFQCVQDTVMAWLAAFYFIVWFLPPSLPQY